MFLGAARRRLALLVAAAALQALALPAAYLLLAAPGAHPAASTQAARAIDNRGHLYVLDGWGGVPEVVGDTYWPGTDSARGAVILPTSTRHAAKGYVLDAIGGIHPFGGPPTTKGNDMWPGMDMARGIAVVPAADRVEGYTLDG